MTNPFFKTSLVLFLFFTISCKSKKEEVKPTVPGTTFIIKKDTARPAPDGSPQRPPIVNITDTIAARYIVLYIKDSASTSGRISQKLAKIYGVTLPEFIQKNKLSISGAPMAWYKTTKAPFFFEAGLPINKKPAKLPKGIFVKDNKKKRDGIPYEIYVTEPIGKDGKAIDPYKVQTDIVYPYQ